MNIARDANNLADYKTAELLHDMLVIEIKAIISYLHPYVPSNWYDKYGNAVIPNDETE
jgi:hypothetical protein